MAPGVRLPGDDCDRDWIWDRQVETAAPAEIRALAEKAWESQSRRLLEVSPFYARKFGEAGAGSTPPRLAELSRLPFSTKDELRPAIEESAPLRQQRQCAGGSDQARVPDQRHDRRPEPDRALRR